MIYNNNTTGMIASVSVFVAVTLTLECLKCGVWISHKKHMYDLLCNTNYLLTITTHFQIFRLTQLSYGTSHQQRQEMVQQERKLLNFYK